MCSSCTDPQTPQQPPGMSGFAEQVPRIHTQTLREPLDRLQSEVPFPAFDTAHVRPVHAENLGKLLLRKSTFFSMAPQVLPDDLLQFSNHIFTVTARHP